MDLPPTKESLFIFDPSQKRHMLTKKEKRNTIAGCPFGHEMPVTCAQVELIISEARVTALPCHVIAHDPTSALPGLAQNPQNISYAEGQILFITVVLRAQYQICTSKCPEVTADSPAPLASNSSMWH